MDPQYYSYLKAGRMLFTCVIVLRPYVEEKVQELYKEVHKQVIEELGTSEAKCTTCPPKKEPESSCKICSCWKRKLLECHSNPKIIDWRNVDPKRFCEDPWEVAKVFMSKGQKAGEKMDSTTSDISAILNLLINCKSFACGGRTYPEAVKDVSFMHYSCTGMFEKSGT